MYLRTPLSACIFLFITAAVYVPSVHAARTFTNEDLEKYGGRSSSPDPSGTEAPRAVKERPVAPERPLRRYAISYEGGSRRIIVPVTFNNRVAANMLLDTGAQGMHISYELARKLGLLDDQESSLLVMIGGIGGSVPAVLTIMDSISVGEAEDHFIPTFISSRISGEFEGLIGMDFMANYEVRIDTKKRVVILEELAQSSHLPAGHDERWWRSTFQQFKSLRLVWEQYRKETFEKASYSDREKQIRAFADSQYRNASELCDRLSVYASEHSVPLEWR